MADAFILSSSAFQDGKPIPASFTCKGDNSNPPLNIIGTPTDAKSLALILHDPDAVSGDFTHWLMWDIPSSTNGINAHSVPVGAVQGPNGIGDNQYMGPCPPAGTGTHHYIFELYALDTILNLPPQTTREELQKAIADHTIAKSQLVGLFAAE